MCNIVKVIEKMLAEIPDSEVDFKYDLENNRTSALYSAPDLIKLVGK